MKKQIGLIFLLVCSTMIYAMHKTVPILLKKQVRSNPYWYLFDHAIQRLRTENPTESVYDIQAYFDKQTEFINKDRQNGIIEKYPHRSLFIDQIRQRFKEHGEYVSDTEIDKGIINFCKSNGHSSLFYNYRIQDAMSLILEEKSLSFVFHESFFRRSVDYQGAIVDLAACAYADRTLYKNALYFNNEMSVAIKMRAELYSALQSLQNALFFREDSEITKRQKAAFVSLLKKQSVLLGGNEDFVSTIDSFDRLHQIYTALLDHMKAKTLNTTALEQEWNAVSEGSLLRFIIQEHFDRMQK